MPTTYVNAVSSAPSGAGSLTLPTGWAAGDLALMWRGGNDATPPTISVLTGATVLGTITDNGLGYGFTTRIWGKLLAPGDTSVTFAGANNGGQGIVVYRGALLPVSASASSTLGFGSTPQTGTWPLLTMTAGSVYFMCANAVINAAAYTPGTGVTELTEASASYGSAWAGHQFVSSGSITRQVTVAGSPDGSSEFAGFAVLVQPADGGVLGRTHQMMM